MKLRRRQHGVVDGEYRGLSEAEQAFLDRFNVEWAQGKPLHDGQPLMTEQQLEERRHSDYLRRTEEECSTNVKLRLGPFDDLSGLQKVPCHNVHEELLIAAIDGERRERSLRQRNNRSFRFVRGLKHRR